MEPVTVVWQSDVKCKSASFLDSCKECISNAIDHQSKHTRKKKRKRDTNTIKVLKCLLGRSHIFTILSDMCKLDKPAQFSQLYKITE